MILTATGYVVRGIKSTHLRDGVAPIYLSNGQLSESPEKHLISKIDKSCRNGDSEFDMALTTAMNDKTEKEDTEEFEIFEMSEKDQTGQVFFSLYVIIVC